MAPTTPWSFVLNAAAWQADLGRVPAVERPTALRVVDLPGETAPAPAFAVEATPAGVRFSVVGRVATLRRMAWHAPLDAGQLPPGSDHTLVRYRSLGVHRFTQPFPVLVAVGRDDQGKEIETPLLDAADLRHDDAWHTVAATVTPPPGAYALRVTLPTIYSEAHLELAQVTFAVGRVLPEPTLGSLPTATPAGRALHLEPIDLMPFFNDTWARATDRLFERQGMVIDGGRPPGQSVQPPNAPVPFVLGPPGRDLWVPPEDPTVNDQPATFAGIETTRRFMCPVGRDDALPVPVGRRISEAFLLLVAELPKSHQPYASPLQPPDLTDIGAFAVQLRYSDGETEEAFPYSVTDGGYELKRTVAVYALAADPARELAQLVVHNRVFGSTVSLAALTVNRDGERLLPHLAAEAAVTVPPAPRHPEPPAALARVERLGPERVRLSSRRGAMVVRLDKGFAIEALHNAWADVPLSLDPSSGLDVRVGDTAFTGRAFATQRVTLGEREVAVELAGAAPAPHLALLLTLRIDDDGAIVTALRARNTGDRDLRAALRFPVLKQVAVGSPAETWVFFPQYRSVITDQHGTWLTPNDHNLPARVLDIYSPGAGLGVGLMALHPHNEPLRYGMAKNSGGVEAFVELPADYGQVSPGETLELHDTGVVFHDGDWHRMLAAYRAWLAGWYAPVDAQKTRWFRELFALRSHMTRKFYGWTLPIYDPESRTYRTDAFVAGDTDYLGMPPQMVHFFGWRDLDHGWDGHPNGDYDPALYTGGREVFAETVRQLQDGLGIPVSLYTISDRVYRESGFGRTMGEALAQRRPDGSAVADASNYYLCPNALAWHRHYAEALRRTQAETGVKVLYVDVFGFPRDSACYAKNHGHPVPSDPNEGCLQLLRELRQTLPDDVVLWSEYPVNDVAMPYIDGFIHYYCLSWHEHFARWYDKPAGVRQSAPLAQGLCRYAYPAVKNVVFLCGVTGWSSDAKFPFFNGEGLYDVSWFLYASPHLDRMRKSLALQVKYADCFTSEQPEPLVPTLRAHLHANRFPGAGRTLWTLYNALYRTTRGEVLAVPHASGATYEDVWNNRPLQPRIENGQAYLETVLPPQGLGCIVQSRPR
jgi:hypothetical protein